MTDWTERSMQLALTGTEGLFPFRRYAVVPNVSWGMGLRYECDLLCLSSSGVFHEAEIKVTASDIRADLKKWKAHLSPIIKYHWFAVPSELADKCERIVDQRFGIVLVGKGRTYTGRPFFFSTVRRRPKKSPVFERNPSVEEQIKFLRLGVMRMWSRRNGDP